jgi:hypothetical protein
VDFSGDVRLQTCLIGFNGCPVDEAFMMSGKKDRISGARSKKNTDSDDRCHWRMSNSRSGRVAIHL